MSLWQAAVDELQGSALLLCMESRAPHALISLTYKTHDTAERDMDSSAGSGRRGVPGVL